MTRSLAECGPPTLRYMSVCSAVWRAPSVLYLRLYRAPFHSSIHNAQFYICVHRGSFYISVHNAPFHSSIHRGAVLLTVGRCYVGNDVTPSTLLDRACACSYENLPKYRSYRVSNTAPWSRFRYTVHPLPQCLVLHRAYLDS